MEVGQKIEEVVGRSVHHDGHYKTTLNLSILRFKLVYRVVKKFGTFSPHRKHTIFKEKFSAGGKDWWFSLEQDGEEDVSIFLYFEGLDCVSAEYSVWLKSPLEGEYIETAAVEVQKYAPNDSNIEGAADRWGLAKWKTISQLQNEGLLRDRSLHLKVIVTVYSGNGQLKEEASNDFKKGLDSGLGSDITFVFVEGEGSQNVIGSVKAHSQILSLRSSYFADMFESGMVAGAEVRISDMNPKAFGIILKYIYYGEVTDGWRSVADELLHGAYKYDLQSLQTFLCENVESVLTLKNVMKIKDFATLKDLPDVVKATKIFITENIDGFLQNHAIVFNDE